eukprot:GHVO01032535.1.p1 GENE.GHVO01032535.1~~GHVO01032535.1.p1  ORF type:complete len:610 (+),score=76.92 GHVO01032535.1:345-2174(+)
MAISCVWRSSLSAASSPNAQDDPWTHSTNAGVWRRPRLCTTRVQSCLKSRGLIRGIPSIPCSQNLIAFWKYTILVKLCSEGGRHSALAVWGHSLVAGIFNRVRALGIPISNFKKNAGFLIIVYVPYPHTKMAHIAPTQGVDWRGNTPFNMRPIWLLIIYLTVMSLTGAPVQAGDPMQEMVKLTSALSHLPDAERDAMIKDIVGFGLSCVVLTGFPVGVLSAAIGPKYTSLSAIVSFALGWTCLFFGNITFIMLVGSALIGYGSQAIRNAHIFVAQYFPGRTAFILSLFGAAFNVSLLIPQLLRYFVKLLDVSAGKVVLVYIVVVLGAIFLVEALVVPISTVKSKPVEKDVESGEQQPLVQTETPKVAAVHEQSVLSQILDFRFLVFLPIYAIQYCRRKHWSQNVRKLQTEIFGVSPQQKYLTEAYNNATPLALISTVFCGYMADVVGIVTMLLLINAVGIGACWMSTFKSVWGQSVAIFLMITNQGYVNASSFAFVALTFGLGSVGTLQGVLSTGAGALSVAMDAIWNKVVILKWLDGSVVRANYILTFVAILMTAAMAMIAFAKPKKPVPVSRKKSNLINRASMGCVMTPDVGKDIVKLAEDCDSDVA